MYQRIVQTIRKGSRAVKLTKTAIEVGGGFLGLAEKALKLYRREGVPGLKRGLRLVRRASDPNLIQYYSAPGLDKPVSHAAPEILNRRVLLIAELSIAQCTKYRVTQKRDMLHSLGMYCTVVSWTDTRSCLSELATHSCVIFYRVPGFESVMHLIAEAKRLRIPTIWEVDDLIFDRDLLAEAKSLQRLDQSTRDGLLRGAKLYRAAMLACDNAIASTHGLRRSMLDAGVPAVHVIENALDTATLSAAAIANARRRDPNESTVRIVYGSGTSTHNVDFEEASRAILNVLARYKNVKFRLIGLLDLPEGFSAYEDRIERIPFCDYEEYLQHLASCDINIAPLEPGQFNDAKSNIKYLEASSVKLPSVCSPRSAFTTAIEHGVNGFLCQGTEQWTRTLVTLIEQPALRRSVGQTAYEHVMKVYSPEYIATKQLAPVIHAEGEKKRLRVLTVNVYYSPRTFGGATIVAEEINRQLVERHDVDVYVFTTLGLDAAPPYGLRRYDAGGLPAFGVGVPPGLDEALTFENPRMSAAFDDVLSAVQPDVVHFHSIQNLGVTLADLCDERGIPYVVTLHDAWWLCGRQFMVTRQGKPCRQTTIDLALCAGCVDNASLNRHRQQVLGSTLQRAAALLAPSAFFADFYRANGVPKDKIFINKNGIKAPQTQTRTKRKGPLRFAYVGGNIALKGVELVREAFKSLQGYDVSLTVVDNALNLGMKSYPTNFFKGVPAATVVPAYTQDNIDDFFANVDVLLFPTQARESFGLVVREALIRNVWVITTDAGGAIEDIVSGVNGLIIPLNASAEDLCEAIKQTVAFYANIPEGTPITLANAEIATFDDQATELAPLLRRIGCSTDERRKCRSTS